MKLWFKIGVLAAGVVFGFLFTGLVVGEVTGIGIMQLPDLIRINQDCPEVLENEYLVDFCRSCNPEDYWGTGECDILCENHLPRCEPCVGDYPYKQSEEGHGRL